MKIIKFKTLYPVTSDPIHDGYLIVTTEGKIKAIENTISPNNSIEVIDYSNKVIIPGLIDAHSHVGIWGDGEGESCLDGNEWSNKIAGNVDAIDGINPLQKSFETARSGGITCLQILPGSSNPIGGLAVTLKSAGTIIDKMIIQKSSGLKSALGENVKRRHGQMGKTGPVSRMGIANEIRNFLKESQLYEEKKKNGEFNLSYESGLQVLKKVMPLRLHAHRQDDIVTAIRICKEFNIDYSIEHCTEGYMIADYLKENSVSATIGPGLSSSGKVESANFKDSTPAILANKGINVSLISDHPFMNCQFLLHYAAVTHKHGLSFEKTLETITTNPAKLLGVSHRVGSLEVGKDADFVILNGSPFTLEGNIEATFIEGNKVWQRECE